MPPLQDALPFSLQPGTFLQLATHIDHGDSNGIVDLSPECAGNRTAIGHE